MIGAYFSSAGDADIPLTDVADGPENESWEEISGSSAESVGEDESSEDSQEENEIEDSIGNDIAEYPTCTSGYEAKFVHPLLKRHECPICLFAMRNPVQTECGHLFCKGCLDPVLKQRRPICPLDKEDISLDGVRKTSHVHVICIVILSS